VDFLPDGGEGSRRESGAKMTKRTRRNHLTFSRLRLSKLRPVVTFYNKRGTCEQWIKEGKRAIRWTRLSCRSFAADAVRLQLHALAYNLGNFLRTLATPEPIKDWSLTSLREKLIKIGAKVVSHGRYVAFQMAEVAIPRNLFADILRLIGELRPPPVMRLVVTRCTKPRETRVLMTENSASLGAPPRAGSPRNASTSHGGTPTTFPSCQSLYRSLSRDKAVIWRMSAFPTILAPGSTAARPSLGWAFSMPACALPRTAIGTPALPRQASPSSVSTR
jgi:Transposase DDE domain group 1